MITAVFTDNDDYAHAYGLWQWDYGQQLRIEGLHLPTAVEIHFALTETGGEAITRVGTTKDGVTTVTIPDSMLEGNSTAWTAEKAYNIYAWVYLSDKSSGETIKRITMQVKARPKPEAFDAPGEGEIFHQAIEAVNNAAKRAEEAGDKAVAAADEAKAAATQTAEHLQVVQKLSEQVEINADTVAQDKQAVAGILSQTQQAASDVALSAQAAKLSETAAGQAQTGAEAAEDIARQYAEDTGVDRQAVANDKQAVSQMRDAVATDRKAVEQTAAQFGQTAQDALTAIGKAQSTAVGAVKAEGNKQTTAVQEAGTQAVKDVTTEGDKQTKRVEDAAANLVDGVMDLAPAILNTASGSVISADDATEGRPFRGLRVFGRSTQDGTPTPEAPIPIVSAGESGSVTVEVGGGNLFKTLQHSAGYYTGNVGDVIKKNTGVGSIGYSWEADLSALPGTEVILSITAPILSRFNVNIVDDNGIILLRHNDSSANSVDYAHTFSVPEKGSRMCLSVMEASAPEGTTIMLNRGPAALPYEPYREPQLLTLSTPTGLPGVPVAKDGNYTDENGQQWVCDEIDPVRGKYVQRIIEKDIIETQNTWAGMGNWGNVDDYSTLAFLSYIDGTNGNKSWDDIFNAGMCNYFLRENGVYKNSKIAFSISNYIAFRVPRSLLPDWDENSPSNEPWINWLKAKKEAGNPVIVRYALKTPIERDLTPEEVAAYKALRTYGPTTVITNNAGAGMEVTYVADTKTYIDNKFAALNKTVLDTVGGT